MVSCFSCDYLCKFAVQQQTLIVAMALAIDDLGTEPVEVMDYGNIITPVINLLTKRYEAHLFTIVTTNLDPKEIHKRYDDRIADRLNVSFPVTM